MIMRNRNRNYPEQGLFWIIDDKIVGLAEEVRHSNYEYSLKYETHEHMWNKIKSEYKVDGTEVNFDYYPRGKVIVDPNYDDYGYVINYSVLVLIDKCINSELYKDMICDSFNLNLKSCSSIIWADQTEEYTGTDYNCHICRKEEKND